MDVSNCRDCRKLLKAELLKGTNPEKLKMKDGHLPGCPSLSPEKGEADAVRRPQTDPQAWPWAEGKFRIAPTPRPPADAAQPAQGWQHGAGGTGDRPAHDDPAGGHHWSPPPVPQPAPAQRPPRRADRGRQRVHGSGYQQAEAEAVARQKPQVQQFKVVDHANSGEQRDHRKGVWFVVIIVLTVLIAPIFPPILLVSAGAIAMLFLLK